MANTLPTARCECFVCHSTESISFSCQRPCSFFLGLFLDCRKQTNKKSLCITHYKEEYEPASLSSRSNQAQPIRARQSHLYADQNETVTTTHISETEEPVTIPMRSNSFAREGQFKYLQDGRRHILRNGRWQPLCKYDDLCTNAAQYEHLCVKHFEITQRTRCKRMKSIRGKGNASVRSTMILERM